MKELVLECERVVKWCLVFYSLISSWESGRDIFRIGITCIA